MFEVFLDAVLLRGACEVGGCGAWFVVGVWFTADSRGGWRL